MLSQECTQYWQTYCQSKKIDKNTSVEASIAGNEAIADKLLEIYLQGKKTAGSGLVRDYEEAGDPLPKEGDHWIILDTKSKPRCIVKTIAVEIHLFSQVPLRIAIAEGEGDLSLEYWREGHRKFFLSLDHLTIDNIDQEQVVTEFFEVVWK